MNKTLKLLWLSLAILFLLNALDALVFGIIRPTVGASLSTFYDRVTRAFLSILAAAAIIAYLKYSKND